MEQVKNWMDVVKEQIDLVDPMGFAERGVAEEYEIAWTEITDTLQDMGRDRITVTSVVKVIHNVFSFWFGHKYATVPFEWLGGAGEIVRTILDDPSYMQGWRVKRDPLA